MKGLATFQARSRSSSASGSMTSVARTIIIRYSPGASVGAIRTSNRRPSTFTTSTLELSSVPLLAQAAEEAGGSLEVRSAPGQGTRVIATFGLSHIDRKPLGDIEQTLRCLRATHPEVSFRFESVESE